MMSGKNKMPLNIIIDFVMLMAMALVSISGFILEIVIPSRHAVRFQDATPWCSRLLGLGRHDWGNIHLWAGVVLVTACHSFPVTHKDGIGFCQKEMPEPYTTDIALCFVIDAVNDDNNALALFMLLI